MAFKPTAQQQKAIETKGNVLVSAAAGSGKTAVLVERVINMLTDKNSGITADRLLIVTFTNAAAAEMRSRIEKRLYEEIQKNPNDTALQKQKYLLNSADICTIDSFCIKLVRENFEKCGVEPDFKISDGSAQGKLVNEVMTKLIEEYLHSPSQDFVKLLELTNCEYDEKNLTELVNRIYLYSQQLPFPERFINGLSLPYTTPFSKGNAWYDMAFDFAKSRFEVAKNYIKKMQENACCVEKNGDKYVAYAEEAQKIFSELEQVCDLKDWDAFYVALDSATLKSVPSSSKDDAFASIVKENKKGLSDILKSLCEMFSLNLEQMQEEISQNAPAVKLLAEIITKYGQRLFDAFKEENAFTFYNMEQLALNLLCEYKCGEVIIRDEAKELCERYDEVLVDEFQDVNDLQNMLFYVLSNREQKLFVVGDVKQSIYGFRGSNPENFLNKKNNYVPIEKSSDTDSKKIILSDNFRSRKGVCDAVNFFFHFLMAGQCGNIIYNEEERLNAGGAFPESNAPTAELLVVDKYGDESADSLLECEAKRIAQYIISVMNEGAVISDGESLRAARYSDFAILLDKVKDKAAVIAEVLSSYGIPVSLGGDAFLESFEISTVMSLLQVIDNPKSDVELLAVMMSPLFAFTADEMAKIRVCQKRGPLYSAVVLYSKNGDKKTTHFIQKLTEYRRDAAVLSVDKLISKLLHSTDILNQMSALDGGKQKRANLLSLIKFAKGYFDSTNGGIYGFIKYMQSLPETSFRISTSGAESTVKIMSMHNSKGLQFPVCILANLSSQINNADSISRVLFSEKGGIAFKYYDEMYGGDVQMLGHQVMSQAARAKTAEEKLRLLYVAATRAIDRLCLVCSSKNMDNKLNKLAASLSDCKPIISREILESSRNMGDWILSVALLHPMGEKLIAYSHADVKAKPDKDKVNLDFDFKISIFSDCEEDVATSEEKQEKQEGCNTQFAQKIKSNAAYVYPYEALRKLQAKASVSRLVHSAEDDRFAFCEKPAFMLGDRLSGVARGTAMHHIMQFINFEPPIDVNAEIERLIEWKFITEQEAASSDLAAIEKFFASKLFERIMASDELHREMRFLTEVPAVSIDPSCSVDASDANIIVQGAIDLCFIEDDGVVVLDFKTDRVDNLSELVSTYGEQLDIYSKAAKKIFGKDVKEKIIYSFHLGESISF